MPEWGLIPVDGKKSTDSTAAVEDELPKCRHRAGETQERVGQFVAQALRFVNAEGGHDHTRHLEAGAARLSMDSVPQAVGLSSAQQRDPCAVHPEPRDSPDCH